MPRSTAVMTVPDMSRTVSAALSYWRAAAYEDATERDAEEWIKLGLVMVVIGLALALTVLIPWLLGQLYPVPAQPAGSMASAIVDVLGDVHDGLQLIPMVLASMYLGKGLELLVREELAEEVGSE